MPYGGWVLFNELGYNGPWLPTFMQEAGYNTYYTGKLMNAQTEQTAISLPATGFNSSDFLVDPHAYDYWNASIVRNSKPAVRSQNPGVTISRGWVSC